MTDTEILDWIQRNVTKIHEDFDGRMTVKWFDKNGMIIRSTKGDNLRDCIRGAIADANSAGPTQ